ncbi:MAG: hypothetical protein GQF41_0299 [Candidatus Rifleibacterium amylolyticum]|nr:MAG: hypothetical protein GQF41_0299 [Candidatus Rifleibacterium amylolyticum]
MGGQIILPNRAKHLTGCAVPMLVFSSPQKELIGRIIKLAWNRSNKDEKWFYELSANVNFNPATRKFDSPGKKSILTCHRRRDTRPDSAETNVSDRPQITEKNSKLGD